MTDDSARYFVSGRKSTAHTNYFVVASDALREFEGYLLQANEVRDQPTCLTLQLRMFNAGSVVIVFSGMCLEALLYDYAASHFTDTFIENYLDALSPAQKLVIYPQLVTGKPFPTDSQAFCSFKALVRQRNKLMHYKSGKLDVSPEGQQRERVKNIKQAADWPKIVHDAHATILQVASALIALHEQDRDQLLDLFKKTAEDYLNPSTKQ